MPESSDRPPGSPGFGHQTILLNASHGFSLINFRGRLIERMVALGHQVHVTAPDFEQSLDQALRKIGAVPHAVPLANTGLNPIADLGYFRAIRSLLREINADLCVSYTIKPNIWASLAARSLGIRSAAMVTGLGYAFIENRGLKQKLVGLASRALYRTATAGNQVVVFQNPDDQADFIAAGCLADATKARMTNGSGVDLAFYSPSQLPDQLIILMVARLLGNKGVREYAAAAMGILALRQDARFLLAGHVGGGPDRIGPAELASWISGGVEYLGGLDDVRPAIRGSSIFVLPSYREGTPRAVLEAMAMGRPIVTTDVAGCRETVVDGKNGLLVPARDSEALGQAMEQLIDNPRLRAEMGARSLELCRSKYDVDRVNSVLLDHLGLA
ncbi:MAG: glycosyltransferase family 4 protein [Sphingomicrobium sp.]